VYTSIYLLTYYNFTLPDSHMDYLTDGTTKL